MKTLWAQKIIQEKIAKLTKIFELYQAFMQNVLSQTVLVLKVSCWRTNNLQPGTTIIKNLQHNGIFNMTSIMWD